MFILLLQRHRAASRDFRDDVEHHTSPLSGIFGEEISDVYPVGGKVRRRKKDKKQGKEVPVVKKKKTFFV